MSPQNDLITLPENFPHRKRGCNHSLERNSASSLPRHMCDYVRQLSHLKQNNIELGTESAFLLLYSKNCPPPFIFCSWDKCVYSRKCMCLFFYTHMLFIWALCSNSGSFTFSNSKVLCVYSKVTPVVFYGTYFQVRIAAYKSPTLLTC